MGALDRQPAIESKIFDSDTINYPDYNLTAFDISGVTNAKRWYSIIPHNLGYIPSYKAYVKIANQTISIVDDEVQLFNNDYTYVPFGASYSYDQAIVGSEAVLRIVVVSGIDEDNLYIGRWANNFADVPTVALAGTVKWVIKSLSAA